MDSLEQRPGLAIGVGVIIGLVVGLLIGWVLWPVEWSGAGPQHLAEADQEFFLRTVAELYSFDRDTSKVQRALGGWEGAAAACRLAANATDPAEAARLEAIAAVVNPQGCAGVGTPAPEEDTSGGLTSLLILGLIFLILLVAIAMVIRRRSAIMSEGRPTGPTYEIPDSGPVGSGDEGVSAIPIARFRTTYTRGHDTYDDSFSIESASGDFLGECGVGISESIGTDSPRNVTAFEVWLFDKNDIRTITKVIMSDHAFFDDAIKAKLATKGEQVLARENETIVLETASLIINAEIKEMEYGTGVLPPQSYFERMTLELSAWAKEGDFASPDVEGRVDELMNY